MHIRVGATSTLRWAQAPHSHGRRDAARGGDRCDGEKQQRGGQRWAPRCALAVVVTGCDAGSFFCGSDAMCGWSETDLSRVAALANLPSTPPVDDSNAYSTIPDAIALGKMFYFDTRFSARRPARRARSHDAVRPHRRGQSAGVACVSCHDAGHAGADPASDPGNVSVGAGWTYNNSLTTFDSAFYLLHLWNGRADSLWAQAVADNENGSPPTATGCRRPGSSRLSTAPPTDTYSPTYPPTTRCRSTGPLGGAGDRRQHRAVRARGRRLSRGCRAVTYGAGAPRLLAPISAPGQARQDGRLSAGPGRRAVRRRLGLHGPGTTRTAVTPVLVNFGKAIAAYEGTLILGPSPFDRLGGRSAGRSRGTHRRRFRARQDRRAAVRRQGRLQRLPQHAVLLRRRKFHNVGVGQIGPGVPRGSSDCPAGGVCDCARSATITRTAEELPALRRAATACRSCRPTASAATRSGATGRQTSPRCLRDPRSRRCPRAATATPSLRNVALTAPYMHDGSIATLAESSGTTARGSPTRTRPARRPPRSSRSISTRRRAGRPGGVPRVAGRGAAGGEVIAPPTLP